MIELLGKFKYALIALVVVVVGLWAYAEYGPQISGTSEDTPEPVGEELFKTLAILEGIQLDGAIFNDPDFLALEDFETEVPPGRAGRTNPFGPTGSDTGGEIKEPSREFIIVDSAESFLQTPEEVSTTTPDTAETQ